MKKSMRRLSLALLITVGPALAGVLYYMFTRPLPKPITIALQIPERAEVRPASAVSPGTFKIEVSLSELLERAKTSGAPALVSWGRVTNDSTLDGYLAVEYWLPRGDSTFFHTAFSHQIHWPVGITTSTLERTPRGVVVKPMRSDAWTILTVISLAVYLFLLVLRVVIKYYDDRRRAQAAAT